MRISCASLFLWDYPIEDIVEILSAAGIESLEFWAETPDFWRHRTDPGAVDHLKDAISVLTDNCTVHAPIMDLNASSYNEKVCEATIKETIWAIDLTWELGASILTIHPGNRTVHRSPIEEDWKRFFQYLNICTKYAQKTGVILALENPTPRINSMCHTPNQMSNVLAQFPDLMMTLDIPHALQVNVGNALHFVMELKARIANIHIGDVHDNIPHYPGHLGQNPQMTAVLSRLLEEGYDKDLTIEIDDKLLDSPPSRSDKISMLTNEREYLKRIFKL